MARSSREIWAKRVERWRASELTAREFAAEIGVNPRTLIHWKWQLGREALADGAAAKPLAKMKQQPRGRRATGGGNTGAQRGEPQPRPRRQRERLSFTEVKLAPEQLATSAIEVAVRDVVVRVRRSFDEETLARVLAVVRSAP